MDGKTLFWIVIFLAVVSAMFGGGNSNTSVSPSVNTSEYNYVKQRVKMEGYSDQEAAQAAEAIIKFHNAQKGR
jgi:hypothetical protein